MAGEGGAEQVPVRQSTRPLRWGRPPPPRAHAREELDGSMS
jgi:hypothetical protein